MVKYVNYSRGTHHCEVKKKHNVIVCLPHLKPAVSLAIFSKINVNELTSFGLNQVALVVNSSNSAVTLTRGLLAI